MKILLYTPYENRWKNSLSEFLNARGHQAKWLDLGGPIDFNWPDVVLSMWADNNTAEFSKKPKIPLFTYVRSYEVYYGGLIESINWQNIKGIFFCSPDVQRLFMLKYRKLMNGQPQYVVNNWLDPNEFPFKNRNVGFKTNIGMLASIFWKKNYPMALQIMNALPEAYQLHLAGELQDEMVMAYIGNMIVKLGLQDRVFYHGKIPFNEVANFLEDMSFILSTSIKEGCPMNVLEAMAMGIKPVVHTWPGAENFFKKEWLFRTVEEAKEIIMGDYGESYEYRKMIEDKHSPRNINKIAEVLEGAIKER